MTERLNNKKQLGQFYTTNYDYILQNMEIPHYVTHIIEPFAGNCDLIKFVDVSKYTIEKYDIDVKCSGVIQRDTLKNPPSYDDKFVLTNPPYLARNKNKEKTLYDLYKCNDLYKCFITNIIDSHRCLGGIIIVPLNFICSTRKSDINLRKRFFDKYFVNKINIFEEKVFDDTGYTVCSISFAHNSESGCRNTMIHIYPSDTVVELCLSHENNYTVGGEVYTLPRSRKYTIRRATRLTQDTQNISNILLKCIDDSKQKTLGFSFVECSHRYIDETPKLSARSYATLVVSPMLSREEQQLLIREANSYIAKKRQEYHSLFLNNYRESTSIARKRISFSLAFRICEYILNSFEFGHVS